MWGIFVSYGGPHEGRSSRRRHDQGIGAVAILDVLMEFSIPNRYLATGAKKLGRVRNV